MTGAATEKGRNVKNNFTVPDGLGTVSLQLGELLCVAEPPAVERAFGFLTQQFEQPLRTSSKTRGLILGLAICTGSVLRFPGKALTQLMSMSIAHDKLLICSPHMFNSFGIR